MIRNIYESEETRRKAIDRVRHIHLRVVHNVVEDRREGEIETTKFLLDRGRDLEIGTADGRHAVYIEGEGRETEVGREREACPQREIVGSGTRGVEIVLRIEVIIMDKAILRDIGIETQLIVGITEIELVHQPIMLV